MAYLLLAVLWIGWCATHSGMIALTTTEWLKRQLGTGHRFYRLFFNLFAVATFMPLLAYTESLQRPALFGRTGLLIGERASPPSLVPMVAWVAGQFPRTQGDHHGTVRKFIEEGGMAQAA